MKEQYTYWIRIYGVVQGVGFRPFIKRLANELTVAGKVKNEEGNVHILATGSIGQLSLFMDKIRECPPNNALINHLEYTELPLMNLKDFLIIDSKEELFSKGDSLNLPLHDTKPFIHVGVDLPLCENCEMELYDKTNRRYRYPMISCVQCGPRYSILKSLPYDRRNTTMETFPLCESCEREYDGRDGKETLMRVHAQTISCHECGPQVLFINNGSIDEKENALVKAIDILSKGGIIAVKGIGGYHFVCKPDCEDTIKRLRQLKKRDRKPFAVMFRKLHQLKNYCEITTEEEQVLLSSARPIVLLKRTESEFVDQHICKEVYGQSSFLGAFLPYTGIQCLLLDAIGPLIFTSANMSNEPILYKDQEVFSVALQLNGILTHTRVIQVPMDDSVVQVVAGRTQFIRRARGYVPTPIAMGGKEGEMFAAGGDLKAVFGFYRNGEVYLSQYIGDLEQDGNDKLYRLNENHMKTLFRFTPKMFLADVNEGYFSHKIALELIKLNTKPTEFIMIQHHHAHIASVMAEHNIHEVIGVAFDGTGLGEDGAVWGSEFLLCRKGSYKRRGHLAYVPVVGYDNAAKNALVMANCHMYTAGIPLETEEYQMILAALNSKINTIPTCSMGRLFDTVAAILKLCQYNGYEGECAISLESAAMKGNKEGLTVLPVEIVLQDGTYQIDQSSLIKTLYSGMNGKENVYDLALSFHYWVVDVIERMCLLMKEESGISAVALSGGVFVNRILLENTILRLEADGFRVLVNEKVPCGDGGIALGQLYLGQWDI